MAESQTILNLADWLWEHRVPEARREEAYNAVQPNHKALIKRGIQCAFTFFGCEPSQSLTQITDANAGLRRVSAAQPADWALLLVDGEQSAAARLTAAAILPRLAGVLDVAAVSIGSPPPNASLVSLELAGIEDIFVLSEEEIGLLLRSRTGCGRICCLSHKAKLSCDGHPVLLTDRKPSLALLSPNAFDRDTLACMHGFVPAQALSSDLPKHCDAVFADEPTCARLIEDSTIPIPLILSPGLEGFWLYPARPVDFLLQKHAFFPTAQ
ncbi:MAG: hypothetical protein IJU76_04230 [Desulfovibrionaceae bacterium]|nr:hypothetical protein [Desulfovibrionaceae bacterium]